MTRELLYLSATEAIVRYTKHSLSPVALMEAVLAEAERLREVLVATTAIHRDSALAAAREAERRYRDGTARPLEGVPVAVKEETAVAGWPRTTGSYLLDEVPAANHPMVDKLLAAGAILHLQTTVPEFCVIGQTWSPRYGVSRNPWNLALTPGGSSGGSGAALAAGLTPLATGSDMAGSIRIPAALNGLYGYKPPFGRLASTPGEELFAHASEGPMTRSFDDLVLMQNVIAGPHPASYSGMPYRPLPATYPSIAGQRIAYSLLPGGRALCPDTRANLLHALDLLRQSGADVQEVALDWDMQEIADVLLEAIFAIFFEEYLEKYDERALEQASSYVRLLVARYRGKRNSIAKGAMLASRLHAELQARVWSQGYLALLCPTVFSTAMPADLDMAATPALEVQGVALDSYLGWVATPPFNLLNRCPALAVPTGLAATGVPTSMQIVAPPFADEAVFAVAAQHARSNDAGLFRTAFPSLAGH